MTNAVPADASIGTSPALRDPAWAGRVFWVGAGLALLWPTLVLTEFKPWVLLEPGALKPALNFVGGFFPPRTDADFLWVLLRETWRTVAIATAGLTLALLLAIPLSLLSVRVLSLSALTGRMAFLPAVLRQCVRTCFLARADIVQVSTWAIALPMPVPKCTRCRCCARAMTSSIPTLNWLE